MDFDSTAEHRKKKEKTLLHGISIKNFWTTPYEVFDALDREFDFDLDAAATAETAKCPHWMGLDHPNLLMRNSLLSEIPWPGRRVFLNPPYSPDGGGIFKWVVRARMETLRSDGEVHWVVLLLPGTMDTDWATYLAEEADEFRFTPRIRFIDPMGGGRTNPMGGSLIAVLRRDIYPGPGGPRVKYGWAPWKEKR